MDEGRIIFERLHEIGRDRVLEQRGHGAGGLELGGADALLLARLADDDVAETTLQIGEIAGEAEDRHHFGGDGDVEAVLARIAIGDAAERRDDRAQRAVVHVDDAPPGDAAPVEAQRIAPIDVIVDQRREQVMRDADGVEVAGEMEVDVLHRHDLRIAAAGRAALHAEAGAERGLAQAHDGLLADVVERVAEADRRRRLAFAGRRRADGGDEDQLAVRLAFERSDVIEGDLRLVMTIGLHIFGGDAELVARNVDDRPHLRGLRNLDIGLRRKMLIVFSARAWRGG